MQPNGNSIVTPAVRGPTLLLAAALLIAGCAAPPPQGSQPRPGTGISEYRQITKKARQAVRATVDSLDALAGAQPTASKKDLARFDRAFHQLELTSVKTRARAEAIIARGQSYFDEWKEQMATTNQVNTRAESDRYARLHEHFERIRLSSGDVRTEFGPLMMRLREFRMLLDKPTSDAGIQSAKASALSADGRRVIDALDAVSKALDEAEVALRATLSSKP